MRLKMGHSSIMLVCVFAMMLMSCRESSMLDDYYPSTKAYYLSAPTSITIPNDGTSCNLTIQAGENSWTIEGSADWMTIDNTSGCRTKEITIKATPNPSGETSRVAVITVDSKEGEWHNAQTITVTQLAQTPSLMISQSSVKFISDELGNAEPATVVVTSNIDWCIASKPDWCELSTEQGTIGSTSVTITPMTNMSVSALESAIKFSGFTAGINKVLNVSQTGCGFDSDTKQLSFSDLSGTKQVKLTTGASWTASTDADWIAISPNSGSSSSSISVSVTENNDTSERKDTVLVRTEGRTIQIVVNQECKYISLSSEAFTFDSDAGDVVLNLSTNYEWMAEVEPENDWIVVNPVSGSGTNNIRISVTENKTPLSRSGQVLIHMKNARTYVVTIVQEEPNMKFMVNGAQFKMKPVEAGTFTMGSTSEEEFPTENGKPVHQVTITKDYYIGQTEVTQALWMAVMGNNPSKYQGETLPVENVTWDDCMQFMEKINILTGKQFRLPTEAEWEYACKGGIYSMNYLFSGSNTIDDVGWYYPYAKTTHEVATKNPNELGLYDMTGNVWEWVQDWMDDYESLAITDPIGPADGKLRVRRGGCKASPPSNCTSSHRGGSDPNDSSLENIGFRLCLSE